jgi:large subunit ribosomal protein L3
VAIDLLCRKLGMTQIFAEGGERVPVTVLDAAPNVVVQRKTVETDGYDALQLGAGEARRKSLTRPELGHFEKAGVAPRRSLAEVRVTAEEAEGLTPGSEIAVTIFEPGQRVDVTARSRGRGTTGVVKRHNFAVKRRTHGTHEYFRHGGSIGAGAYPGHVIKGLKMAGRHGNERVTTRNLEVVRVDAERGLLFLRGAVPGHPNTLVRVRPAVAARG